MATYNKEFKIKHGLLVDANGSERMRISSDGVVAIGTSSPSSIPKLQINGDGEILRLDGTGGSARTVRFRGLSTSTPAMVTIDGSFKLHCEDAGTHIEMHTANAQRHRIGSSGKASWSANGVGNVTTQDRDFTFYSEGSTNGVDIRSNDYRLCLIGAGGSSGAAMDKGYLALYNEGTMKVALNANGNNFIKGGHLFVDNGIGQATHTTMDNMGHTWQTNVYNTITAGAVAIGSDSSNTSHMWWNVYDTGSKYAVSSGYGMDQYVSNANGSYSWRFSDNASGAGSGVVLTEQFRMKRDGMTHVGLSSSNVQLFVSSRGGAFGGNSSHNVRGSSNLFMLNAGGSGSQFILEVNGANRGTVTSSSASGVFSDRDMKENIQDIEIGKSQILQLKPRRFKYKTAEHDSYGFIAQEVADIIPLAVDETTLPEPCVESGKETIKTLDMNSIFTGLVKAFQEQEVVIQDLKTRLEALEG